MSAAPSCWSWFCTWVLIGLVTGSLNRSGWKVKKPYHDGLYSRKLLWSKPAPTLKFGISGEEERHMAQASYDVIGIGSAIVDILSRTDDGFIQTHGLVKGTMALVTADRSKFLYDRMGVAIEISGGSAANTMAGIASLGGSPAFIGKVGKDQLGEVFSHDIKAGGVDFLGGTGSQPTATCHILVTPDGQRTMNTYLGACTEMGPDDIDAGKIADAHVIYIEGYQWDTPQAKAAIRKATKAAKGAGRKVALSLSDPFVVDRHRGDLLGLIKDEVDILFGNEDEIFRLYEASDLETAVERLRAANVLAVMTRGAKGAVVFDGDTTAAIDAAPVAKVVDTTGAGDLFAAGFLFGFTHGRPLESCARIGAMAAAEVISHMGARPETPLRDLLVKHSL
jgi:sugar/nucleoside kinase (ribokinase family)